MPTETGRHRLYEKIKEQWGEEHAAELMSYLPPVGWADVATKHDLDALRVATKGDLDALRVATKGDLEALRVATHKDLEALRVATHKDLDALRVATHKDLDALRVTTQKDLRLLSAELRGEMQRGFASQLRWILGSTMTAMVVLTGLFGIIVGLVA